MSVMIDSKCPKCGGTITNNHDEVSCINCGYDPLAKLPAGVVKDVKIMTVVEKRPTDPKKRNEWYHKHKEEIRKDIELIGFKAAADKWGFDYHMASHFMRAPNSKAKAPASYLEGVELKEDYNRLPHWSDSWIPEVQIKWLDVWLLARRQ